MKFAPPPKPTDVEMILLAMEDLGGILADELNALWSVAERPWYRRWRRPDRDALVESFKDLREHFERQR